MLLINFFEICYILNNFRDIQCQNVHKTFGTSCIVLFAVQLIKFSLIQDDTILVTKQNQETVPSYF